MGIEKRQSKRFDCLVPVYGQKGGMFDQTRTTDVSKGGVGLISAYDIPIKKEIAVELDLGMPEPVLAIGRIKWSVKMHESEYYRLGIAFIDLISNSDEELEQYFSSKDKSQILL